MAEAPEGPEVNYDMEQLATELSLNPDEIVHGTLKLEFTGGDTVIAHWDGFKVLDTEQVHNALAVARRES